MAGTYVYIYIHVAIYIETERKREREVYSIYIYIEREVSYIYTERGMLNRCKFFLQVLLPELIEYHDYALQVFLPKLIELLLVNICIS